MKRLFERLFEMLNEAIARLDDLAYFIVLNALLKSQGRWDD